MQSSNLRKSIWSSNGFVAGETASLTKDIARSKSQSSQSLHKLETTGMKQAPLLRSRSLFGFKNSVKGEEKSNTVSSTQLRLRIANVLLSHNQSLLSIICQTNFVGDAAAMLSVSVLAILQSQGSGFTEDFLKRSLREKMEIAGKKGKVISDILRDNSMTTMLLNAYTREIGNRYLHDTLEGPLRSIYDTMNRCEIDPEKIRPEDPPEPGNARSSDANKLAETMVAKSLGDVRDQNEQRLKDACLLLLDAILNNQEHMPIPLRRMAFFIRRLVQSFRAAYQSATARGENASTPPESPSKEATATSTAETIGPGKSNYPTPALSPTQSLSASPALSTAPSTSFTVASSALSISESIPGLPEELNNTEEGKDDPFHLTSSEKVLGTFLFLRFFVPAITSPDSAGLLPKCSCPGSASSIASPVTPISKYTSAPVSVSSCAASEQPQTDPVEDNYPISTAHRRGFVLCGKILTALCNGVEFGTKEQYMMPLNEFLREHRGRLKVFFSWVSQVVEDAPQDPSRLAGLGTLYGERSLTSSGDLLLRSSFSSQTTNGSSDHPPPNERHGLAAEGSSASPTSPSPSVQPIPSEPAPSSRPASIISDSKNAHISSLTKLTGDSDPSHVAPGVQPRAKNGPRNVELSQTRDIRETEKENVSKSDSFGTIHNSVAASDHLIGFLGKSMPKIEKDVESRVSSLPPEEAKAVLENFYELKKLIELQLYAANNASVAGDTLTQSNQTLWGKLTRRLTLRHWFQGLKRSSSFNDVPSVVATRGNSDRGRETPRSSNELRRQSSYMALKSTVTGPSRTNSIDRTSFHTKLSSPQSSSPATSPQQSIATLSSSTPTLSVCMLDTPSADARRHYSLRRHGKK